MGNAGGPSDTGKNNKITVDVLTIDDAVSMGEVFLMKIDAEGYEVAVLEGALQTLARTRHLIVEINSDNDLTRVKRALGIGWQGRRLTSNDYIFSRANI